VEKQNSLSVFRSFNYNRARDEDKDDLLEIMKITVVKLACTMEVAKVLAVLRKNEAKFMNENSEMQTKQRISINQSINF